MQYVEAGVLVGRFYDAAGRPTAALTAYQHCVAQGLAETAADSAKEALFPSCSSHWAQGQSAYVWCDSKALQGTTDHVSSQSTVAAALMVPRKVAKSDSQHGASERCACFPVAYAVSHPELQLYEVRRSNPACDSLI